MIKKRKTVLLAIIFLIIILSFVYPETKGKRDLGYSREKVFVIRVIDGDTIETDIGRIRLLGINTPERRQYFYEDAKNYLKQLENQSVYVLRDFKESDNYNRKLRYVFYGENLINVEILEKGLAIPYMTDNLKYEDKLKKAQNFAKESEFGIWEKSSSRCSDCIEFIELNPEKEFIYLKNNCNYSCLMEGLDEANNVLKIKISGNEDKRFYSKRNIWNNDGDSLFIRDSSGLIFYYNYP